MMKIALIYSVLLYQLLQHSQHCNARGKIQRQLMYVCMYVCMYVYMHACMYVYIHIICDLILLRF